MRITSASCRNECVQDYKFVSVHCNRLV